MKTTRVYILGQHGAGKTTILNQLHTYFRSELPDATKMTSNKLDIMIDEARFVISDVNLPMTLSSIYLNKVSKGDKFILVYAVDDNDSFEYIESIKDFLVSRKGEGIPITVVGNKNDHSNRALRYELVDCLVSIDWEMKYIEMSALTSDCVPSILKFFLPEKENFLLPPPTKDDSDLLERPPSAFRQRSNTDSDIAELKQTQKPKRRSLLANQDVLSRQDGKNQQKPFRRFSLPCFRLAVPLSSNRLLRDTVTESILIDNNIEPDIPFYENKDEVETTPTKEKRETQMSLLSDLSVGPLQETRDKDLASGYVIKKRRPSFFTSKLSCLFDNKEL